MKTVLINPFAGKIEIQDGYNVVREGMTQTRDLVCADYRFQLWTQVKAGGMPVNRYAVVIRPSKGARPWNKQRKFDKPAKQRKGKTAKKTKKATKK